MSLVLHMKTKSELARIAGSLFVIQRLWVVDVEEHI